MHSECINTYAKNAVRVQPLAACPPVQLNPYSSSLQKPSVYFIKRNLFPPVEMHYNTNSYPPRKRFMKFSSNPDADRECVASTRSRRGRLWITLRTSRRPQREGMGGGVFVLREGSRAMDTYYEGGGGILIGWGVRLCVGWLVGWMDRLMF